jgi:hypothetical protein
MDSQGLAKHLYFSVTLQLSLSFSLASNGQETGVQTDKNSLGREIIQDLKCNNQIELTISSQVCANSN